ncbi:uracil-DNA glycosylase-like protein [Microdochium bolleyi]|uniref:Uracil-DNA glycosylase-like protein n=1 Tax=Microdochium bolleyi TaxID=196109 RepID=A0A136J2L8_9PEZI|nr:uracil-DNA glycosylase-like protein [Microdochium bolleyi]
MDAEEPGSKEPSFAGRLRIKDFLFSPSQASGSSQIGADIQTSNNGSATVSSPRRQSTRLAANPVSSGAGRASLSPAKQPAWATAGSASPLSRPAIPRTSSSAINRKQNLLKSQSPSTSSRASSASPSPSKKNKRARVPSSYAPPSTYAHLPPLPDAIAPDLIILFIGLNPGISTSRTGHAYAHPSNLFWKLLASSGITPVPCTPEEDRTLPQRFSLGFTNIVSRPSRNGAELSKAEMDEGVGALEDKCARWRPEAVCIVGKSIWESIFRVRKGRAMKKHEFSYGWQDGERRMGVDAPGTPITSSGVASMLQSSRPGNNGTPTIAIKKEEEEEDDDDETDTAPHAPDEVSPWQGARIFVASSTSGLAATLKPAEKEAIWKELGDWCVERRRQRQQEGQEQSFKTEGST